MIRVTHSKKPHGYSNTGIPLPPRLGGSIGIDNAVVVWFFITRYSSIYFNYRNFRGSLINYREEYGIFSVFNSRYRYTISGGSTIPIPGSEYKYSTWYTNRYNGTIARLWRKKKYESKKQQQTTTVLVMKSDATFSCTSNVS
jgi:hypothetical protein